MAERAAGWLRAHLDRRGLGHYQVYCANDLDLHDIDEHVDALGGGEWEAADALVPGGLQPTYLPPQRGQPPMPAGVLHLRAHEAVVARWYWFNPRHGPWQSFRLFAAPTPVHHQKLVDALLESRRRRTSAVWQVVSGEAWNDGDRLPREGPGLDALVMSGALRGRLDRDVVAFFSERAAALYAKLAIPYRRGVLLYGPPGNGKTSIIRALATRLPRVSGFVLRATGSLDDDDFTTVVRRWTAAAPAILVIEDLNWLFPNRVTVSTFLNLLDGLGTPGGAGLMVVASTNHPETLDPAISDRPGRFDVVLEVPSPDAALRRKFFRAALPGAPTAPAPGLPDDATVVKLTEATAGLSFAHLREVMQAAGLSAMRAGREARTADDLLRAAEAVAAAHRSALHGFPVRTDEPFGLARLRSNATATGDEE